MQDENDYFEDKDIDLSLFDHLEDREFINCNFDVFSHSEISFKNTKFIDCCFRKCDLSNTKMVGAVFRDTVFDHCKLLGINWSQVSAADDLKFSNSILDFCVFNNLELHRFEAIECRLKEADFSQCYLKKADFSGSELRGVNFNGCDLTEADFRGARNYFIDPNFSKIKKAKFDLPEATSFFKALGIDVG